MERDIAKTEESIQSITKSESLSRHIFSLKFDTSLEKFISIVKTFGKVVKETRPNNIHFLRQKDKPAQLLTPISAKSIDDLTLMLVQSINTYSNNVKGCTMLPDGRMVCTCYHLGYAIEVNQNGSKAFEIKTGTAFDVVYTYVVDNDIAVTSGYSSQCISLIDIELKNVKKTLNVGSGNDGMTLKDEDLIYCGRKEGLEKISLSDGSVSTLIQT